MEERAIKSRINEVLVKSLGLAGNPVSDNLMKQDISTWDSLKHIMIVAELEMEFDVQFEPEEMEGLNSTDAIFKVLTTKQPS